MCRFGSRKQVGILILVKEYVVIFVVNRLRPFFAFFITRWTNLLLGFFICNDDNIVRLTKSVISSSLFSDINRPYDGTFFIRLIMIAIEHFDIIIVKTLRKTRNIRLNL